MRNFGLKAFGAGAGLRHAHFQEIIETRPPFRWFEIINEDFMNLGGFARDSLNEIRRHYQIVGHGVCMSVGSTDPLDMEYLKNLKMFLDEINSPWTSDHLCFTVVDHTNLNDLIPLPFTKEAVENCVQRLKIIQDYLERPFLVENVTRYVTVSNREMSESEFISSVLEGANCGLLLDVTNAYLNSIFHKYDPWEFIQSLPLERVGQVHLAGWEPDSDGTIIDSHDAPVPPEVWALFQKLLGKIGSTSALIEWDNSLPPLKQLLQETIIANKLLDEVALNKKAA